MPRGSRKGVDLLPLYEVETTTLDALAADGTATMMDQAIENVNSNEDYGSGSIKGLRVYCQVKPEAVIEFPPRLTFMIIPSGMTAPTVKTNAARKQNERFIWGDVSLAPYSDPAATSIWWAKLHLKTARRFHSGDRLLVQVANDDPAVAFGAAAVGFVIGRAYVTED